MTRERGYGSGGLMGWFFQRLSGVVLIPLVIAHMLVTHYVFGNPAKGALELDYNVVASRLASPWWKLIDISFLFVVLYHGLRGIWVIIQESVNKPWFRIAIWCVVLVFGVGLAVLGTITILPFRAPMEVR